MKLNIIWYIKSTDDTTSFIGCNNFMRLRYQNHLNSSIDQLQMYVVSYALTKGSNSDIEWKLILILLS